MCRRLARDTPGSGDATPRIGWREVQLGMACVLAFVDDLFFQAKILETAKQVGVDVRTFTTSAALLAEIGKQAPQLVIVDLNAKNNPVATIARLRATEKELPIVAFLSHVQVDLAAQAKQAGSTQVLPRSAFTQNLASILAVAKD